MEHIGDNQNPEIPDDISELIADIVDRKEQRTKAVEIMLKRAEASISDDERDMWLQKADEMQKALDDFNERFPEL